MQETGSGRYHLDMGITIFNALEFKVEDFTLDNHSGNLLFKSSNDCVCFTLERLGSEIIPNHCDSRRCLIIIISSLFVGTKALRECFHEVPNQLKPKEYSFIKNLYFLFYLVMHLFTKRASYQLYLSTFSTTVRRLLTNNFIPF